MPRIRQDVIHENIRDDIKATARRLMAADGAAGLSLRAIAREMDVTAPALYRYYPSLDDLITALILDGFNGLADALQAAYAAAPATSPRTGFLALARAYRQWAVTHTIEYMLIYGVPIPGYEAPSAITVPAAVRVFEAITQPIEAERLLHELQPRLPHAIVPESQQIILQQVIDANQYPTVPLSVYLAFEVFARLYGLVMPALLGHLVPLDTELFFEHGLEALCLDIGFKPV